MQLFGSGAPSTCPISASFIVPSSWELTIPVAKKSTAAAHEPTHEYGPCSLIVNEMDVVALATPCQTPRVSTTHTNVAAPTMRRFRRIEPPDPLDTPGPPAPEACPSPRGGR